MNKKFVIGGLVVALFGIVVLVFAITFLNKNTSDVGVADPTNPNGLVCEEKQFDILLLVDGSGSPVTYGIDDDLQEAVDSFVDSLDLSNTRLSIMDKRGWGNYSNTGFTTDKTSLKSQYKTFGFVGDPACSLFRASTGGIGCPTEEEKITNRIRTFLDANQRTYNNETVPTVIITFDDGDRAQLPQLDSDFNSCNPIQSELEDWQSLEKYGDMYWIRFENPNSNTCSFWQQPDVLTRGRGSLLNYDYQNGNSVQNLIDQLENIFQDQCRLVLQVEKSNEVRQNNGTNALVEYTVQVTNPNSYAVENSIVEDTLPSEANSVTEITPSEGTFDPQKNTIRWNLPIIQPNQTLTYTYTVEYLEEDFGQLLNEVCVFVDTNNNGTYEVNEVDSCDDSTVILTTNIIVDPVQVTKSGEISLTINEEAGDYDAYTNYTLIVTNPNDYTIQNVYIVDQLPDSATNALNILPTSGVYTQSSNKIEWTIPTMTAGEEITLTYTVGYNRADFGRLENVVEVFVDLNNDETLDETELNDSDDEILNIPADFGLIPLGIIKNSVTNDITNENALVTYTLEIYNPNDVPVANVIVEDQLPSENQQVENISNQGVLDAQTNKIRWDISSIGANSTLELTYDSSYSSSSYSKEITNTAAIYIDINTDQIPQLSEQNDTDSETVDFIASISANIDKNVVLNFENPNGTIANYTLTVTNNGETDLANLIVEDTYDSKIQDSYFQDLGSATKNAGVLTWNISSIKSGDSVELKYSILIPSSVAGEFTNNVALKDSSQNVLDTDTEIFNIIIEVNDGGGDGGSGDSGGGGGNNNGGDGNGGVTPTDSTSGNDSNSGGSSQAGNDSSLPNTSLVSEKPLLILLFGAMFVTLGSLLRLINIRKYIRRLTKRKDPFLDEVYDDIEL